MNRIQQLVLTNQEVFHTQDLARIWGIDNPNTLYITASRYTAGSSPLFPIQKGLYSLVDPKDLDPKYLISSSLLSYDYVSTETVLHESGIILQNLEYFTLVGQHSKKGLIQGHAYKVRQLKDEYLLNDLGVEQKQGYKQATVSRAVADLLYFNSHYHFDNRGQIDWPEVGDIYQRVYGKKL